MAGRGPRPRPPSRPTDRPTDRRRSPSLAPRLLACDSGTWRQLITSDATIPCVVGDDRVASRVSTLAEALLAGQQYAFDRTRDAHYERWDGATECRTALENGRAPGVRPQLRLETHP